MFQHWPGDRFYAFLIFTLKYLSQNTFKHACCVYKSTLYFILLESLVFTKKKETQTYKLTDWQTPFKTTFFNCIFQGGDNHLLICAGLSAILWGLKSFSVVYFQFHQLYFASKKSSFHCLLFILISPNSSAFARPEIHALD